MKPVSSIKKSYLSLTIAAILAPVGITLSTPALANNDTNSEKMETVVIVGEKIDKTLKDTTTAVTVITEEQFENGEIRELKDIVVSTPNVSEEGFGTVSIRGIDGAGAAVGGYAMRFGSRARVSTVIDNDSQAWSGYGYTPSKLWDVNQVEVLLGPQSTAQGTNSIGGTIVSTTNDPTYYWEGAVRGGFETYENGNVKYNTAIMASGPLIENELAFRLAVDAEKGEGWITYEADDVDLNDYPDLGESENINARLKVLWEPESISGLSVKLTGNKKSYEGEYLNWATDDGYNSQTFTISDTDNDNTRNQDSDVESIATDIDYQLTSGITNSFHIGYGTADITFEQYPDDFPVISNTDSLTVENKLLFQSPESNFSSVLGLYYSNTDAYIDVNDEFLVRDGEDTITAVYGETTYSLNSKIKVVGGARLENQKSSAHLVYSTVDTDEEIDENIFLPKVGIIYDVDANTTVNASIREGYNAGGYGIDDNNDYYSYDEESVISYETGMRSTFGSAELSTNLFYNDYSNYVALNEDGAMENIDSSYTYGLEVAGSLWATNALQLRSSMGYLKTEVTSDDYEGNELSNAPEINVALGMTHYVNQYLSYSADVYYVGEYYSDLENTSDYEAGDYVTANINIQYEINDFVINGYINNLTDEDVVYYHNNASRAAVGQSRTFGLNTTYRW